MSGHSKWSTIKRKKEAEDKKRGASFTKLARAITVAVQEGGSDDPEGNFALRLAIDRARTANMPKDNIQRAIDRGAGKGGGGESLKEVVYEGFGPQKVAIVVEVLTDNTNRAVSEIKKIFETRGGSLASPGSVSYLFEKKGLVVVEKRGDFEEVMLKLIDLGAEEVEESEDAIEAYVRPEETAKFRNLVKKEGLEVKEAEIVMRPKNVILIEGKQAAEKILGLMEALDSHDDVQKVWANFDIEAG